MEFNFAMTTVPTIVLWIVGLVIFGIGALLGYVNMNLDARKKIDAMETNAEIMRTEAERKLADAEKKLEEAQLLRASTPGGVDVESLLRLKKENNRMVVEMDGKPLSGVLSPEGKKRLLELISHVRPYIEGTQTPPPASKPAVLQTPLTQPPHVPLVSSEVKPVSILSPLQPAKKLDPEKEFALLSIVQQIDTVLQKKLVDTPLENAGIRLQDSPQGAVEVYVGLQKYESVDDVPDEKIKAVIRAAITEWESKYIPGM
ncbi:MAG: hypothetical protein JNM46_03290 [Anaerolineales bacterium]|nr:hypothetical protein [Anaerolineales bacterium]